MIILNGKRYLYEYSLLIPSLTIGVKTPASVKTPLPLLFFSVGKRIYTIFIFFSNY